MNGNIKKSKFGFSEDEQVLRDIPFKTLKDLVLVFAFFFYSFSYILYIMKFIQFKCTFSGS